jgi:hypothetical protein
MTRDRIYGEDTPFSAWMRNEGRITGTMPSSAFVSSDIDFLIHRYKTVIDSCGTREIQALMILEVKTNSAKPRFAQLDSMWLHHLCSNTSHPRRKIVDSNRVIVHHGVSFLSMSGTTPMNSQKMEWGRFRRSASIEWREIDADNLIDLMMFDIHPDNFERNPYRRHHITKQIDQIVALPLGFTAPITITKRS